MYLLMLNHYDLVSCTEVLLFSGLANYYCRFVQGPQDHFTAELRPRGGSNFEAAGRQGQAAQGRGG